MLQIVTWKWQQPNYRSKFESRHVNTLCSMLSRNLKLPHEFVCFTDEQRGIAPHIRVLPLPKVVQVQVPERNPNCFRRLWAFSDQAREVIGERFVSIDLDCVITGDMTPVLERDADFMMWGDTVRSTQYNGSLWLMKAGARRQVWDKFRGQESYEETRRQRMIGSDQAWISMVLGRGEKMWTREDGVYSFRTEIAPRPSFDLPENARVIFFHGVPDPWQPEVQAKYPWIREHYR